ncbi:protein of unknown function [Paraburkholderia dioscoreae]|uniref:Uncharacterized protein n=1 Tax=Paraburkholderia dioscoreae TaxID=2604047 RepID=A0A5Q4ZST7_9BURK|nr:protein of unknown function [Paraburkholderia dioscoreae]
MHGQPGQTRALIIQHIRLPGRRIEGFYIQAILSCGGTRVSLVSVLKRIVNGRRLPLDPGVGRRTARNQRRCRPVGRSVCARSDTVGRPFPSGDVRRQWCRAGRVHGRGGPARFEDEARKGGWGAGLMRERACVLRLGRHTLNLRRTLPLVLSGSCAARCAK